MKKLIAIVIFISCLSQAFAENCYNDKGDPKEKTGENCPEGYNLSESNWAAVSSTNARARGDNQSGGNDGQNSQTSRKAKDCTAELKTKRAAYDTALNSPDSTTKQSLIDTAKRSLDDSASCRTFEIVALSNNESMITDQVAKRSSDGIATCYFKAGFTTDYKSCSSTLGAYNAILVLDKLMVTEQGVRNAQNQQNVQNQATKQTASGDGQNAIYDASLADNQFKKNLGQEQLMAYTAAVALLGQKLATWKSGKCGGTEPTTTYVTPGVIASSSLPDLKKKCADLILDIKGNREVVANDEAKTAFASALMGYVAKAAMAKALIDRMNANSAIVNAAKDATNSPDGSASFEKCIITPLDPACIKQGAKVTGSSFTQGDFTPGEGSGNNSFDLGSGAGDSAIGDAPVGSGANGAVAGIASPFGDQAKAAKDILNPANAASVSPGGSGGGGGGGASGGMGGGGANLGNDLQGADKGDKPSDIKANKLGGNYASAGGKGFNAVAGGKEDNPFASLFDSKSQGGLEEDRSIASDEGGVDSGIFQKIHRRYEQVNSDKRLNIAE